MEINDVKDDILFDFSINMPRLMISGRTAVLDNVKKIIMLSETSVVLDTGNGYVSVNGDNLVIKALENERMYIAGDFKNVEFL